jgi:LuxR family maltose regulon positive regulatory protein
MLFLRGECMAQSGLVQQLTPSISPGLPRIALTRTAPPAVRKFAVNRPRLISFLENAAARRLVLFKAPPGYGKTTLAVEWFQRLRDAGGIVAWLSLDADDNEPGALAYHLARALETVDADVGKEAIELLQASSLIPARNVVSSLLNAVSEIEGDAYLFLDDFQIVTDPRCHELIALLLRYAPSNLHLALISRTEPRFPLSRIRLDDEIAEVDASLLKFNLQETGQFLGDALSQLLGPAGVTKLHSATEGWPAALQLARISLLNSPDPQVLARTFSGTARTLSDYFEDTLATEPADVVDFLLKTSILDELTGPLCGAVAGSADGISMLRALEREQFLLVALDDTGEWFRYHHLMRDFLRGRLSASLGDQVPELHRRAYRWYAGQELWKEAVQHAIAAGDFPQALEFVEHCAMSLVGKGDLLTLLNWEQQLPAEVMSGQLEVKLALAWGMALVTRFKEAEALLTQVEAGTHENPGSDLWWRCRAARAVLCALRDDSARGKDVALECLAGHAFDHFNFNALCNVARYAHLKTGDWQAFYALPRPDTEAGEASYVLPENYRLCLYGLAAVKQLKFDEALGFYAAAQSLAERYGGAKSASASMLTGLIARLQYERGDVAGAEVLVLDSLDLIESTAFHEAFRNAYFVLVRAAAIRGDRIRAVNLLNRAERLSWERGWGVVIAMLLVERTRVLLADGNIDDARALLPVLEDLQAKHPVRSSCSSTHIVTWSMVAKGLIDAASGNLEDAAAALDVAFDGLLATDDRFIALRVGIDLVALHARLGSAAKAHGLLKRLMSWGAEANMPSFILDHDRRIIPILSEARNAGVFDDDAEALKFANGLLKQMREPSTPKPAAARSREELTERERAIVERIAMGRSNKEIARELGVTPETIKTHLKRIFQKLSAESRAQAVVRAQSLGMLKTQGAL